LVSGRLIRAPAGETNVLLVTARLGLQEPAMSLSRDRIIAIACSMLLKRGVNAIPGSGDNLRDAGLTSLDMVNLMLAIEAEFNIEIPQSAMTPDNFDTVAAIDALVSMTAKAA
jgi:acyl carrier protein